VLLLLLLLFEPYSLVKCLPVEPVELLLGQ
jgi:hypothetical protein